MPMSSNSNFYILYFPSSFSIIIISIGSRFNMLKFNIGSYTIFIECIMCIFGGAKAVIYFYLQNIVSHSFSSN